MSRTDRELLELAALAHGGVYHYGDCWRTPNGHEWVPLRSNEDTQRLIDKLGLIVERHDGNATIAGREDLDNWPHEPDGDDPGAAERRAVVRAAAEIGYTMKEHTNA